MRNERRADEEEKMRRAVTRVPVAGPPSDYTQELERLMDSYGETMDKWILPLLHLPYFPYSRDVGIRYPRIDVIDYVDKFMVVAELPGYEKEDIELRVNGFSLHIIADRTKNFKEGELSTRRYIQRERIPSSFRRIIEFAQEVTPEGAKASLKNGLLEIEIPKIEESSHEKRVRVPVS